MKLKPLSTILILVVCSLLVTQATAATKVFLLGGQSNMAGYMTGFPTESPYNAPLPDVQFWNYSNNGWVDLQPGFGDSANDIGPEVGFGHALNDLFPDDDIYLVKYGQDSTNLAVQWNPNGTGSVYNIFKSRVDAALANLAGQSPEIAGMIWMQGESDAQNSTYSTAYNANLTNFINTVRSDFSTPDMPFVIGRITDLSIYSGFPGVADVRAAQVNVAAGMSRVTWIDTDDIEQNPAAPGHYIADGQVVLGTRFANSLASIGPVVDPVPVETETLFYDDFEDATLGTATHFTIAVTADPGTWTRSGDGVYDFRFATSVLSTSSVDGSGYYGSTLVGNSGVEHTYINANFTPQSNSADLIRFELDCSSLSAAATMEIGISSGGIQCNSVALGSASSAWYHVMMEYYPGASTYDLTINGQTQTGLPMTTVATTVDSLLIHGTGGNWASFDNVKVTSVTFDVPEPSMIVSLLILGLAGLLARRK